MATSNAYAAQAGLDMLKRETPVTLPWRLPAHGVRANRQRNWRNAFAIVAFEGNLYGLNASGPAPQDFSGGFG